MAEAAVAIAPRTISARERDAMPEELDAALAGPRPDPNHLECLPLGELILASLSEPKVVKNRRTCTCGDVSAEVHR